MGFNYDYKELSSEVLFGRYAKGDILAFDALLARHQKLIFSLIMRYVRNPAHADEIFQEVFYKICKNKDQFRESVSFKSWLATIAKNTSIDFLRRQKKELGVLPLDDQRLEAEGRPLSDRLSNEDDLSPLETVIHRFEDTELNTLLDELPVEQKETFVLKVVMDMTFEEIAVSMKISVNTAKSRHRYALKALRGLVKRQQLMQRVAT